MLRAENIQKSFGSTPVLRGVSLQVKKGDVVAIIGPSGSGKSTFLRCLNHLETVDSGSILIDGAPLVTTDASGRAVYPPESGIRPLTRKMGMVFQSFNLFPHFSVLRNVTEAPMHVLGLSKKAAQEKARALLAKVGLADKAEQYPYQLSGGQC